MKTTPVFLDVLIPDASVLIPDSSHFPRFLIPGLFVCLKPFLPSPLC